MPETICDLSELPVSQCACRIHATVPPPGPEHLVVARFPGHFDSTCGSCSERMYEGDLIARTDEGLYICMDCCPKPPSHSRVRP